MPSISMDDLECAMHSMEQGTRPSWAGERSVVLTRHQSGLSWQRSSTSTVWPRRTVSSLLLLAMKSCITTVSSQPPESWGRKRITKIWLLCEICHRNKRQWCWIWNTLSLQYFWSPSCITSYLIAVQCVLGSAGCKWDGIWLAAAFTLTVQILSVPAGHKEGGNNGWTNKKWLMWLNSFPTCRRHMFTFVLWGAWS